MDTLGQLWMGFGQVLVPENLMFCFIGALIGTLIGVLPGVGPLVAIAVLLPITYFLSPLAGLIMLSGIYYGAQYGGSTTAILVRLPGENSSIVTCIDGYEMARQGRAGAALAVAALASLFAGCVATLILAIFSPFLIEVALLFGPPEYCALMVLGLVAAIVIAQGPIDKALAMIVLGLLLGSIGTDVNSGVPRFTFGVPALMDGIGFIPLAMGVFAMSEVIKSLEDPEARGQAMVAVKRLWPSADDFRRSWPATLRGTAIGSILGILPGGGAYLGSFVAYAVEKRVSSTPERFGAGAVEGVAAPESANNAAAQTSFIPLLSLGIPGNAVIALMAGAMMMQGIQPGPQVMTTRPELFWGLIASMFVGNLMLVIINLPLIRVWVMLLKVPYRLLYPAVIAFACIGTYTVGNTTFDIFVLVALALLGYVFLKLECEPAPLLLAFVVGPLLEENFRRAMHLSRGHLSVFVERPISAGLLVAAVVLVAIVTLPGIRRSRERVFEGSS
jgi:putative tricarboxylic transport membrane protein